MATFLSLCQDVVRECGISATPETALATVTGQTGQMLRVVRWVRNSWTEIQNRQVSWRWMRSTFTCATTASDSTYAYTDCLDVGTGLAIDRFRAWRLDDWQDPPKIYLTASGNGAESFLIWTQWDGFKFIYKMGSQTDSYPAHIAVDPADQIVLGPAPNDAYTLTGDYWKSAQIFTDDADVPEMPPEYHSVIMYEAMKKYAGYSIAPEILMRAESEGIPLMRALESRQLPKMQMGGALV